MARFLDFNPPLGGIGHLLLDRNGDCFEHRNKSRFLLFSPSSKSFSAFSTRRYRDIVCQLRPLDGVGADLDRTPDGGAEPRFSSPIDADTTVLRSVSSNQAPKVNLPPRICTLRAFGKSPAGVVTNNFDETMSAFCKSLAANIEFKVRVQDWEILSGRLAMMIFASALLLEAVTGNSVFQKLDPHRLLEVAGAFVISSLFAAGFAVAWSAKTRVAYTMSKGYEKFLNALIDNVVDGLFFDDDR